MKKVSEGKDWRIQLPYFVFNRERGEGAEKI